MVTHGLVLHGMALHGNNMDQVSEIIQNSRTPRASCLMVEQPRLLKKIWVDDVLRQCKSMCTVYLYCVHYVQ